MCNKLFYRLITVVFLVVLISASFTGCGSKFNNSEVQDNNNQSAGSNENKNDGSSANNQSSNVKHPKVQIEMEDGGKMVLELYPEYAPETVNNFVQLVEKGFYDGLTFHRIVKGFMIQGGDPEGTGVGGSGKNIKGEFSSNGFTQNTLKHTRGVISMARSGDPNSASSQFFIVHADSDFLDGDYAAFGKLVEGFDTLDKIADTPCTQGSDGQLSSPTKVVKMKKVTVLEK